jgi:hypothetical protein
MVASGLSPQRTCMGGKGLPRGGYYALVSLQQLAYKFEPDATTRAYNQPGGAVLIGVQNVGYLIHQCCGGRRATGAAEGGMRWTEVGGTCDAAE